MVAEHVFVECLHFTSPCSVSSSEKSNCVQTSVTAFFFGPCNFRHLNFQRAAKILFLILKMNSFKHITLTKTPHIMSKLFSGVAGVMAGGKQCFQFL